MDRPNASASDETALVAGAKSLLQDAGWWIDEAKDDEAGSFWWIVTAIKGESLFKADGATREEAWLCAVEQARSLGVLDASC